MEFVEQGVHCYWLRSVWAGGFVLLAAFRFFLKLRFRKVNMIGADLSNKRNPREKPVRKSALAV